MEYDYTTAGQIINRQISKILKEEPDQAKAETQIRDLLAKASESPEAARHVAQVIASAEVPLRPVEKKDAR